MTNWEDLHNRSYEPERIRLLLAQIAADAQRAQPANRHAGVNGILDALFGPEPDSQDIRDEQVAALDEANEVIQS